VIGIPVASFAPGAPFFLEGKGASTPVKGKAGVSLQPDQPGGLLSTEQERVGLVPGKDSVGLVYLRPT